MWSGHPRTMCESGRRARRAHLTVGDPVNRIRQISGESVPTLNAPDSLRAISGIRLPTRSAIGAGPMTGKATTMEKNEGTQLSGSLGAIETQRGWETNGAVVTALIAPKPQRSLAQIAQSKALGPKYGPSKVEALARVQLSKTCKRGHPLSGDNLYVNPKGRGECRACRTASGLRYHRSHKDRDRLPSEETLRATIRALHEGSTLSFITKGRISHGENRPPEHVKGAFIIEAHVLKNFMVQNPKLGHLIKRLAEKNRLQAHQAAVGRRIVARRNALAPACIKADIESTYAAIQAATASLPDFLRDDVRSAMFLAAAEGRLKPRDAVKRVREFVTAHNRQFSTFVPGGGGIMRSLDEQVYDDGPTRLVDTVTRGLWQ